MRLGRAFLIPFHGLSRADGHVTETFLTAEAFDLVCSFPLLEDLTLNTLYLESDTYMESSPDVTQAHREP